MELLIVNDNEMYNRFDKSIVKLHSKIGELVNAMNVFTLKIRMHMVIIGIETFIDDKGPLGTEANKYCYNKKCYACPYNCNFMGVCDETYGLCA